MISCDRCKKDIGEPLDRQTYTVTCEDQRSGHYMNTSLAGAMQLCGQCVQVLQQAIVRAIHECLKGNRPPKQRKREPQVA